MRRSEGAWMAGDRDARIAQLEAELQQIRAELGDTREQQAATADGFRVIAASPTDSQAVLAAIVASATHLCRADDAGILRVAQARLGYAATTMELAVTPNELFDDQSVSGRVLIERRTIGAWESREEHLARYPRSKMFD